MNTKQLSGQDRMMAMALMVLAGTIAVLIPLGGLCSANVIIGGETDYVVKKGETLELIGARLGVHWKNIAIQNGLEMDKRPEEGTLLKITTRKIVPKTVQNGIIINIADRTLYFFRDGKLIAIPVGVGKPTAHVNGDWKTSTGRFHIKAKKTNPTWYVPESIQIEALLKGKEVVEEVPPGPGNPLGRHALVTSKPGILIHETNRPSTVYRYSSHGCIRVLPEHMKQLFSLVQVGEGGEIIYEPVKVATGNNGKVYLEVRSDVYKMVGSLQQRVQQVIEAKGLSEKVDWGKVEQVVRTASGIAEDVSFSPPVIDQRTAASTSQTAQTSLFQRLGAALKSIWQ